MNENFSHPAWEFMKALVKRMTLVKGMNSEPVFGKKNGN